MHQILKYHTDSFNIHYKDDEFDGNEPIFMKVESKTKNIETIEQKDESSKDTEASAKTSEEKSVEIPLEKDIDTHFLVKRIIDNYVDEWHTLFSIRSKLEHHGIFIFPEADAHKYVNCIDKDGILEMQTYYQMALLSSAIGFGYTQLNGVIDAKDKIILPFITIEDVDVKDEFPLKQSVICSRELYHIMPHPNDDTLTDNYNFSITKQTKTHATLYHSIKNEVIKQSEKYLTLINSTHTLHVHSVYQLLRAIRPIICS
ncbi:hypothetical protein SNEBB_003978 [Seison nebaliae]|nr:hypothetical protein SNEBB_003978 [Seison nebaliae]